LYNKHFAVDSEKVFFAKMLNNPRENDENVSEYIRRAFIDERYGLVD